jgi:uncharacterized coiled-coil DUF342 family protein
MDDLMNKVSALIESHVKSEVDERSTSLKVAYKVIEDARRELNAVPGEGLLAAAMRTSRERDSLRGSVCGQTSKDEIRRGARALGFWEKLVETLCIGPADEETFEHVMERIQVMKEWKLNAEGCQKQIEVLCERITAVRAERDEARRTEASFTAQFDIMRKERDEACALAGERLTAIDGLRATLKEVREDRDSLVRDGTYAQHQLKELLSALGLTNYTSDKRLVEGALKATRERDARLVAERDALSAQLRTALEIRDGWSMKAKDLEAERDETAACAQSWREKAQALEAKLLEVRKAAAQDAPEKHAACPDDEEVEEAEGFRVGDLVQLANMQPPHVKWQAVTKLEGDGRVHYGKYGAYAPHMLARKPVEAGDRVRIVGGNPSHIGATFVVRRMSNNGLAVGDLGSWSLHNIVAIAP